MHYPGHIEFFDVDDQESGAQDDDNLPVLMLYIGIVALLLIYVAVTLWPQGGMSQFVNDPNRSWLSDPKPTLASFGSIEGHIILGATQTRKHVPQVSVNIL